MWKLLFAVSFFSGIVKTHQSHKCDIRIWHIDLMENILVHTKKERTPMQRSVLGKIDRMVEVATEETAFMPCSVLKTYSALVLPEINLHFSEVHEHSSDEYHYVAHSHPATVVDESTQKSSEKVEAGLVETMENNMSTKTIYNASECDSLHIKSKNYEVAKDQNDHNKSKQLTLSAQMEHEKTAIDKDEDYHINYKSLSSISIRDSREEGDIDKTKMELTDKDIQDSESNCEEILVYSPDEIPPMGKDKDQNDHNKDSREERDTDAWKMDFMDYEIEDSESTSENLLVYSAAEIPLMDKGNGPKSKNSNAPKEQGVKETQAGLASDVTKGENVRPYTKKGKENHLVKPTTEESGDNYWKSDFTSQTIKFKHSNGGETSIFTVDQAILMENKAKSKKNSEVPTIGMKSSNVNGDDFHAHRTLCTEKNKVNTNPSRTVLNSSGYKTIANRNGVDIMTGIPYLFETKFRQDKPFFKSIGADKMSCSLEEYFFQLCCTCGAPFGRSDNLICTYLNLFTRHKRYSSQDKCMKTYILSKLYKADQIKKLTHERLSSDRYHRNPNKNVNVSSLPSQYTNIIFLQCSVWDSELGSNSSHRVRSESDNYSVPTVYSESKKHPRQRRELNKPMYVKCIQQTLIYPERYCSIMCQYLGLFLQEYNIMYLKVLSREHNNNISAHGRNEHGELEYDVEEFYIYANSSNSLKDNNTCTNDGFNVGEIAEGLREIKMDYSFHTGSEAVVSKDKEENTAPGVGTIKHHKEKSFKGEEPGLWGPIASTSQFIGLGSNQEITNSKGLGNDSVNGTANEKFHRAQSMKSRPIYVQESQQNAQIQHLELMIVKLENRLLSKSLVQADNLNSMQSLQKHVLKVENDLLKLNQTYQRLQSEYDALKSEQKKGSSLSIQTRTNPRHPYCPVRKEKAGNEIIIQQKTKIVELSDLVYKQSREFKELQSEHYRLEEQNKHLFQMMMNQNSLISKVMLQLNEMNEKSMAESMKSQELYLKLQFLQTQGRHGVFNQDDHIESAFHSSSHTKHSNAETNYDDYGSVLLTRLLSIVYPHKYTKMLMKIVMLQSRLNIPCPRICLFNKVIASSVVPFPVLSWFKCETIPGTLAYQMMSLHTHSFRKDVALDNTMKTEYSVNNLFTSTANFAENNPDNSENVSQGKNAENLNLKSSQPWAHDAENKLHNSHIIVGDKNTENLNIKSSQQRTQHAGNKADKPETVSQDINTENANVKFSHPWIQDTEYKSDHRPWTSNLDPVIFPIEDEEEDGIDEEVSDPNTSKEDHRDNHQRHPPREVGDKNTENLNIKSSQQRTQHAGNKAEKPETVSQDINTENANVKFSHPWIQDTEYKSDHRPWTSNLDPLIFPIEDEEEDGIDEEVSDPNTSKEDHRDNHQRQPPREAINMAQAKRSKNDEIIFFPIEDDGYDEDKTGNENKGSESPDDEFSYSGNDFDRQQTGKYAESKQESVGEFDDDDETTDADEFKGLYGGFNFYDNDGENEEEGSKSQDDDSSIKDRDKENKKDGKEKWGAEEHGENIEEKEEDGMENQVGEVNGEDTSVRGRDKENEEDGTINQNKELHGKDIEENEEDGTENQDEEVNQQNSSIIDEEIEEDGSERLEEEKNEKSRSVTGRNEDNEDGTENHDEEVNEENRSINNRDKENEDGSKCHYERENKENKRVNDLSKKRDDFPYDDSNTQSESRNRNSEESDTRSEDSGNYNFNISTRDIGEDEVEDSEQYFVASKAAEEKENELRRNPQEEREKAEPMMEEIRLPHDAHQPPLLDIDGPENSDDWPADCHDLYKQGKVFNGSSNIRVRGMNSTIRVMCHMQGGGWTVLLKRENGNVDFYQDFKQYREGFGDPSAEHYIGNKVLHYLTSQKKYVLKVTLMNWEGESTFALYDHFLIDNEETGYRLHIQGFSGTAGDGLSKHNGMKFSTHDVDNDLLKSEEMGGSCAKRFKGAGWYYRCYMSNLMGVYYKSAITPPKKFDGITWKPWFGPNYSMKKVVMSVRPLD